MEATARGTQATEGLRVRGLGPADRSWLKGELIRLWGSTTVVSRGREHDADGLGGFACEAGARTVGLATYEVRGGECELVTLDAFHEGQGIGSVLLEAVAVAARHSGCRRLWLITSNDNLRALRFYQRRWLRLVAVYAGAIDEARLIKPEIPKIGGHGIPIHDELELELPLQSTPTVGG